MSLFNTTELIQSLKKDLEAIELTVQHDFSNLNPDQSNWKPDSESWSILECLEHITLTNKIYQKRIKEAIQGGVSKKMLPKETFRSGFLGDLAVKAMKPGPNNQVKNKLKTFKFLVPYGSSLDGPAVLGSFSANLNELRDLLDESTQVDLKRIKIISLAGRLIQLRLGDAFRFIIVHTQRHIIQAQKLQTKQGFPS